MTVEKDIVNVARLAELLGVDEITTINELTGIKIVLRLGETWMSTFIDVQNLLDMKNPGEEAAKRIFELAQLLKRTAAKYSAYSEFDAQMIKIGALTIDELAGRELDQRAELIGVSRDDVEPTRQLSNRFEAVLEELKKT